MYLSELKLWNFRKYGIRGNRIENSLPGLSVTFNKGVNVLVGENDSGKTAIVDAIRYVLKTQSLEFIPFEDKDFYKETNKSEREDELKIECTFKGFSNEEAAHFLEWIGFDSNNDFVLRIWIQATRRDNSIYQTLRAGIDADGSFIEGDAKDLLRVIYLKPLRDALSEMTTGNKSRLAQILKSLDEFKQNKDANGKKVKHKLEVDYSSLKETIDNYFETGGGKEIHNTINKLLKEDFFLENDDRKAIISLAESELNEILKQLNLILESNKSGLGSLNLLFIAAELLHLVKRKVGLKLTLIEELEAHLHPQYQLRLIDFVQSNITNYGQFILTTHSTTLASNIKLENLIICKGTKVFPMGSEYTELAKGDYKFLERFLDATKSNMFFAKGVIIVEGDAENLLLPTFAKIINRPLSKYGVSIVNVGNTAYKRYSKIFIRKNAILEDEFLDIPISIISDLDIRSIEYYNENGEVPKFLKIDGTNIHNLQSITDQFDFSTLKNSRYSSISNFWQRTIECKKVNRFKTGVKQLIEEKLKESEVDANKKNIKHLRRITFDKRKSEYPIQNVDCFIPINWTLEFEIASSRLKQELKIAIEQARLLNNDNNLTLSRFEKKDINRQVQKFFREKKQNGIKGHALSYEIFKPLLYGLVSKAITAQCLAEVLSSSKINLKEIITRDLNLTYLCEAIYHVTKQPELGGN